METIINILMRRDGLSRREAKQAYLDCKAEIEEALIGTSCIAPENVLQEELGLEIDYIFYFI